MVVFNGCCKTEREVILTSQREKKYCAYADQEERGIVIFKYVKQAQCKFYHSSVKQDNKKKHFGPIH